MPKLTNTAHQKNLICKINNNVLSLTSTPFHTVTIKYHYGTRTNMTILDIKKVPFGNVRTFHMVLEPPTKIVPWFFFGIDKTHACGYFLTYSLFCMFRTIIDSNHLRLYAFQRRFGFLFEQTGEMVHLVMSTPRVLICHSTQY